MGEGGANDVSGVLNFWNLKKRGFYDSFAGGAVLPAQAAGYAGGRQCCAPPTPWNISAAVDGQLWPVHHPVPECSLASVSTPEVGQVPGREQPSHGEGIPDGAGPSHA